MTLRITVGTTALEVVPFERFDDFRGFSAHWAPRLAPGPAVLDHWDHVAGAWRRSPLAAPIVLRPALQCLVSDGFGLRDPVAEQAMMARICAGLGITGAALREAVEAELPPARFTVDPRACLTPEQQARQSWDVYGQAHFEHFVLRGAVGRLSDWILLSLAIDFTLAARPARGPGQDVSGEAGEGALTERMSDFLGSRPKEALRRAGLRARS